MVPAPDRRHVGEGAAASISGPGAPQTYWNGKSGGTKGTVWSALLTTGKVSSGDKAILTFSHVSSTAKHYREFNYTYPSKAFVGGTETITATVTPKPPAGHLLVQQLVSSKWSNVVTCVYVMKSKDWSARSSWHLAHHQSGHFRLLATAAPGLLTTASLPFVIGTAS